MIQTLTFESTVRRCKSCGKMSITPKADINFCNCGSHNLPEDVYPAITTQIDINVEYPSIIVLKRVHKCTE